MSGLKQQLGFRLMGARFAKQATWSSEAVATAAAFSVAANIPHTAIHGLLIVPQNPNQYMILW
jgi:hypothetical protein